MPRWTRLATCVLAACSWSVGSLATGETPSVEIRRVARPPVLEDFLGMDAPADLAATMTRVGGRFLQRFPADGAPSSQRTDVWLGYDDHDLYAVFVAFDDEPSKIRATLGRRETIFGDDIVQIMLDTFSDQRRAYSFICNPLGVQFDAIWAEGTEFDSAFDTVWRSRGALTDRGYVVWMAIPFRSLRFPKTDVQTWGLLFNRDIPRGNEETFWPAYTLRIQGRLNQMGRLTGLTGISPGRNVHVIPFVAARRFRALDEEAEGGAAFVSDRADADAGVDAKFVVRDSLVVDLTANPDFSQVESDAPQVAANRRFELYYPEKRPFFLENATTFTTPIELVFTRRIGEPRLGARLTGKAGPWSVGALAIDDESAGAGERAQYRIARIARDVGRQSSLGVLVTSREHAGGSNVVASADARVKWNDHWTSNLQAARSRTQSPDTATLEDDAYDLSLQRDGEHLYAQLRYVDIGPGFRAQTGYVPRVDIRDGRATLNYTFRPAGPRLVSWGPRAFFRHVEDHEGLRLDQQVEAGFGCEFPRQTEVEFEVTGGRERLRPQDAPGVTSPLDFSASGFDVGFSSAPTQRWRLEAYASWFRSANYNPPSGPPTPADATYGEALVSFRPLRRLALDLSWIESRLDDDASGDRIFTNRIARLRGNLQIDPRLSIRAIVQQEDLDADPGRTTLEPGRRLNADLLVTYLVNPWTAFYLGANSDWQDVALAGAPSARLNDGRQVFLKASYLFR